MKYKDFIKECGDKQVFKKLSIYIVSSWVIIQVLAVLYEPLGLPKKSISIGILLLLLGFPFYIYYIWRTSLIYLELEGDELFNEDGNPIDFKKTTKAFHRMFFISLGAITFMVILSSSLIINNTFNFEKNVETIDAINKIAVLKFGNNTGDEELDILGKMASDWIIHGITENNVGQVISPELIDNYSSIIKTSMAPTDGNVILNDYLKPGKIIVGNYYLDGNNLLFQGSIIINNDGDNITTSFRSVECNSENPIDCIENLKQVILGYLITEKTKASNLQEIPPKFEAYQYVLEAKDESGFNEPEKELELLKKAIEIDPNYFEPKVLMVSHYYNNDMFEVADSIRKAISLTSPGNLRQKNLLNFYEALLNGNNKLVYQYLYKEYQNNPFDISTNTSMLVIALQFANRLDEIDAIYNEVSFNNLEVQGCLECSYRTYIKTRADVELRKYEGTIPLLKKNIELYDYIGLKKNLISAYIRSNQLKELEPILERYKLTLEEDEWTELYMFSGKELLLAGNKHKATDLFNSLIDNSNTSNLKKGKAHFYSGNYKQAKLLLEKVLIENPNKIDLISKLAICSELSNNSEDSKKYLDEIYNLRAPYTYGEVDYAIAQYYASIGKNNIALEHLKMAVADGCRFEIERFQNDPQLLPVNKSDEFEEILNFWND